MYASKNIDPASRKLLLCSKNSWTHTMIVSCRTSEQKVDKNQSVTVLIIPNKKLALLAQKYYTILLKLFQMVFT